MAKVKPRKAKNRKVAEFPAPSNESDPSEAAALIEGLPDATPQTPELPIRAAQPTERRGRPPGRHDAIPRVLTFFQNVARIQPADWGTRAKIRVYRIEPIIDMLRGSQNKYIRVYEEPVTEEKIKVDHGSGRYKLFLNFKGPAEPQDKEIDSVEFDILDRNFPPNIPEGAWVEDPRNKKWGWAKPAPAGATTGSAASSDLIGAMRVINEIQNQATDRERERTESEREPTWDPSQQLKAVADVAKDLAGALKATPENPIPAFISEQMTAMRAELAEQRRRSDTLMDRLLERANAPQQQTGLSAVKEIMQGIKDFLPTVRDLWPTAPEDIAERVTRSKMGPWQEFFQPILPRLVDAFAPIVPGIVMSMGSSGNRPAGPPDIFPPSLPLPARSNPSPGMMQPPQAQPQAQHGPNLDEMLLNALTNDRDGGEFADSLIMLFGQQGQLMYRQAASLGEQGLLNLIQHRPVWNQLGPLQSKVAPFVHEFIEWGQEPPVEPPQGAEQPPAADGAVVDLTGEPAQ